MSGLEYSYYLLLCKVHNPSSQKSMLADLSVIGVFAVSSPGSAMTWFVDNHAMHEMTSSTMFHDDIMRLIMTSSVA